MSESLHVKLFSLDRMARFKDPRNSDVRYIVPGEVLCIASLDNNETWVEYGGGKLALCEGSVQDIENEINRALGATHSAHLQASREASNKLRAIVKDALKDDDEILNMNDFIPKGVN